MRPNLRFLALVLAVLLPATLTFAQDAAPAATPVAAPAAAPVAPAAGETPIKGDPAAHAVPGIDGKQMALELDAIVTKLVTAYNAGDAKAFNAEFGKTMAAIATDQIFQTMYVDNYMANFGKVVSRTMDADRCSFNPDAPLVVYIVECEKQKGATLAVNFIKEETAVKVMQVQFQKAP